MQEVIIEPRIEEKPAFTTYRHMMYEWQPRSPYDHAEAPDFELYDEKMPSRATFLPQIPDTGLPLHHAAGDLEHKRMALFSSGPRLPGDPAAFVHCL